MEDNTAILGIKRITFGIEVIRADGTVEDLGVVSEYNRDVQEV